MTSLMDSNIAGAFIAEISNLRNSRTGKRHLKALEETFALSEYLYNARKSNSIDDFYNLSVIIYEYFSVNEVRKELVNTFEDWMIRWREYYAEHETTKLMKTLD